MSVLKNESGLSQKERLEQAIQRAREQELLGTRNRLQLLPLRRVRSLSPNVQVGIKFVEEYYVKASQTVSFEEPCHVLFVKTVDGLLVRAERRWFERKAHRLLFLCYDSSLGS